jgi:hypothetical protein
MVQPEYENLKFLLEALSKIVSSREKFLSAAKAAIDSNAIPPDLEDKVRKERINVLSELAGVVHKFRVEQK